MLCCRHTCAQASGRSHSFRTPFNTRTNPQDRSLPVVTERVIVRAEVLLARVLEGVQDYMRHRSVPQDGVVLLVLALHCGELGA